MSPLTVWHWDNVMVLPPGTPIRVFTTRGRVEGRLVTADFVDVQISNAHGSWTYPVGSVSRVDRLNGLAAPTRAKRALLAATVGTALVLATSAAIGATVCHVADGEGCSRTPSVKSVAALALVLGGGAALSEPVTPMTIYLRP
jgi:hypothetical protein